MESEALLFKIVTIDVILNQLNLKNDAEPKETDHSSASEKIKNLHLNQRSLRSPPPKRHKLDVGGPDQLGRMFPPHRKQRPSDKTLACGLQQEGVAAG
jgi:hypothetical protein